MDSVALQTLFIVAQSAIRCVFQILGNFFFPHNYSFFRCGRFEGMSCGRDVHRLLDSWMGAATRNGDQENSSPGIESAGKDPAREELEVACLGLALEMMVIVCCCKSPRLWRK